MMETTFVTIIGFGSLLSERSSRSSFPTLQNFRKGRLRNWRRIFGHATAIFYERGIAKPETNEISSLSVEPCEGESILFVLFEISNDLMDAFYKREEEFRFVWVEPEHLNGTSMGVKGLVCAKYSDEEYRQERLNGSEEEYWKRYGKWGIEKIWRDDIFPCRIYARHCVLAAEKLGEEYLNNFLDHTFLGDRKTTLRMYLNANPQLLLELPPPSLAERYSG